MFSSVQFGVDGLEGTGAIVLSVLAEQIWYLGLGQSTVGRGLSSAGWTFAGESCGIDSGFIILSGCVAVCNCFAANSLSCQVVG